MTEARNIQELLEKTKVWQSEGLKFSEFPLTPQEFALIPELDQVNDDDFEPSAEAKEQSLVPVNEFDWLLTEIGAYWNEGWTAKKIAQELGIGQEYAKQLAKKDGVAFGAVGYPRLKVKNVYYFVERYGQQYDMKPRHKKKEPTKGKLPHLPDMPTEVSAYLRERDLLIKP